MGQPHLPGVVPEPRPSLVVDAVLAAVDGEAVQVLVAPAEGDLQYRVQLSDAGVLTPAAARSVGPDPCQHHPDLVHGRVGGRHGPGHIVIVLAGAGHAGGTRATSLDRGFRTTSFLVGFPSGKLYFSERCPSRPGACLR
jgi:hypothetical protein